MSHQESKRRRLAVPTKQSKLHNFFKKPSGSTQDLHSQLLQCSQTQGEFSQSLFPGSSSHTTSTKFNQNMMWKDSSSAEDNPFSQETHYRTILSPYEQKSESQDDYLPTDCFSYKSDSSVKILDIADISSTNNPGKLANMAFVELDSADCLTPQEESLVIPIQQMPNFKMKCRDYASYFREKVSLNENYTPIEDSVSIPIGRVNTDMPMNAIKAQNATIETLDELDSQLDCCTPSEHSVAILPSVKRDIDSLEELDSQFGCFTPAEQSQSIRLQQLPKMPFESNKLDNHRVCKRIMRKPQTTAPDESTIPADIAAMFTLGDTYIQGVERVLQGEIEVHQAIECAVV